MRKRNDLTLKIFEKYYQESTGLIQFGPVAPTLENVFFSLALFRKKEQKTMLEGKALLLKMLRYQTIDGLLADAIHQLQEKNASWKKNILIAAAIQLILDEFEKVIDKESKEMIISSKSRILTVLKEKELPSAVRFLKDVLETRESIQIPNIESFEDIDLLVAALSVSKDEKIKYQIKNRLSDVLFEGLRLYHGPFKGIQQMQGYPVRSILELSMIPEDDLKEDPSISDKVWMSSVLSCDLTQIEGNQGFLRHVKQDEESEIFLRAFLDHEKGLTACMMAPKNTTYDAKSGVYSIPLTGMYEEDAHEIALFFTLDPSIKIHLNGQTTSLFEANQIIHITNLEHDIPLAFRVADGEGSFVGHISLDSKPYELEKGGMYDRKISIRTLERSSKARIELFIGWNNEKCPF